MMIVSAKLGHLDNKIQVSKHTNITATEAQLKDCLLRTYV